MSLPESNRIIPTLGRLVFLLGLTLLPVGHASAQRGGAVVEEKRAAGENEFFLYRPARIDPKKTYWLAVGVHGMGGNGKGAAGIKDWAKDHDCIVLGPTFQQRGFVYLTDNTDQILIDMIAAVNTEFRLHERVFVTGFSAGGQFAHRFMLAHPDRVIGCAAHSAGTWATGEKYLEWGNPIDTVPGITDLAENQAAKRVPLLVTCNLGDTNKSFPQAPLGRLEWAQRFAKLTDEAGYVVHHEWFQGRGHQQTRECAKATLDWFEFSTYVYGGIVATESAIQEKIERGDYG